MSEPTEALKQEIIEPNVLTRLKSAVVHLGQFVAKHWKYAEEYEAMDPITNIPRPQSISTAQMRTGARLAAKIDFSRDPRLD